MLFRQTSRLEANVRDAGFEKSQLPYPPMPALRFTLGGLCAALWEGGALMVWGERCGRWKSGLRSRLVIANPANFLEPRLWGLT